jgi:hypothetical protein
LKRTTTVYPLSMIATTLPQTIVSIIVRLAASEALLVIRHNGSQRETTVSVTVQS